MYWSCAALADKGALPSLWECGGCAYMNGRRQPIPRSLPLFIDGFNRGGEESIVCLLRNDGHFQKAQQQVNPDPWGASPYR